jgi:hypothetical protein
MHRELEKLGEILEDGGKWGRRMDVAVKAGEHPDRPLIGRLWANELEYMTSPQPGANTKTVYRRGDGKYQRSPKKTFRDRTGPGFRDRGLF